MTRFPIRLRRLTHSLVFRLIVFGVLLLLLGTVGRIVVVTTTLRHGMESVVSAQLMSLASYVANDIHTKVSDRRQLLTAVSTAVSADPLAHPLHLSDTLAQHHALAPLFSLGMLVVPLSGQGVLADFPAVPERATHDFSGTDWFRAARDGAPFFVGDVTPEALPHNAVVMAVPVRGAQGQVVAVVAGATPIEDHGFLHLMQTQTIGQTGGFLLISPRDKRFVASSIPRLRLQTVPRPGVNALHDQAMEGWRGTGITVNAFGVEEVVAVVSVPAAEWFVVARLPTEEAFEPVAIVRRFIVHNGVWLSLLIVLVLVVSLNWFFRPLKQAARHMRKMADGDMPLAPLTVVRPDEVGEMVEGFNHLLARLQASERRLSHLAHHDPLTGLPNRRALLDQARQSVALAQRQGAQLAVLFVDIDGFKPVNDGLGHEAGDLLLQTLALRLAQTVRQADVVARLGGDEFVVLLTDAPPREQVAALALKLIAALSRPCVVSGHTVAVGASVGIALYPDDAADVEALVMRADQAMYVAKRHGRGTYRFA